jgi:IS605 OrfB family transposase
MVNTVEEEVVQTIKLPLQTNQRKNQKIQKSVNEYQQLCKYYSNLLPSFNEEDISSMNTTFYRRAREKYEDKLDINSNLFVESQKDVIGAYDSWRSNGKIGELPNFGEQDYFSIPKSNITIEENNNGFGLKLNFIPYKPEWFSVNVTPYNKKYLNKIVNGEYDYGSCEIHKHGDNVFAHLVVKWDVISLDDSVDHSVIGVDLGEKNIYTTVYLNKNDFTDVNVRSGSEFRHYRERLKQRRDEMQSKGDLKGVKECSGEHERYTEQIVDTCSMEIVDIASNQYPCKIILEDLTNYRNTAPRAIHDWPFALIQQKIMYKAKERGIPCQKINPRNTSKTCRVCGHISSSNRNGDEFECKNCGYEVHADVNGAMNIALRGSKFNHDDFGVVYEKDKKETIFDY